MEESFQTAGSEAQLSTARWLDYRNKVARKVQFPVNYQQQVGNEFGWWWWCANPFSCQTNSVELSSGCVKVRVEFEL